MDPRRAFAVGIGAGAIVALGCSANRAEPENSGGGGPNCNAWGGATTTGGPPCAAPDSAGSWSAGATGPIDLDAPPGFQRIEPAGLPADVRDKVPPTASYWINPWVPRISRDGGAIVVQVEHRWDPPPGGAFRAYRWTPASGIQLLPIWAEMVSGDCSAVFDYQEVPPSLRRWTEAQGTVELVTPELADTLKNGIDFAPSGGPYSSYTGQSLLARGHDDLGRLHTLLWEAEAGWRTLGPDGAPLISDDGSAVLIDETRVWSRDRGVETLPDGCMAMHLALATGIVLGICRAETAEQPSKAFRRLADGSQVDFAIRATPRATNMDGSVVVFTNALGPGYRGFPLPVPVTALWSESTGELALDELDGSEALARVADSGVVLLLNDIDEVDPIEEVTSSRPLRWSPEKGREHLEIPVGYEYAHATAFNTDGSVVVGFSFNGSYRGPTIHSESEYRLDRERGVVTVWDEQGPRLLIEELADLVSDPSDLEEGRPSFVSRTQSALYVIGHGSRPHVSQDGTTLETNTVWVATLPLR